MKTILPAMLALASFSSPAQIVEISSEFNPSKPILPCSQYTPDQPYTATV